MVTLILLNRPCFDQAGRAAIEPVPILVYFTGRPENHTLCKKYAIFYEKITDN